MRWSLFRRSGRIDAARAADGIDTVVPADLDVLIAAERHAPAQASDDQARAVWAQLQVSIAIGAGAATAVASSAASAAPSVGSTAPLGIGTTKLAAMLGSTTGKLVLGAALAAVTSGGVVAAIATSGPRDESAAATTIAAPPPNEQSPTPQPVSPQPSDPDITTKDAPQLAVSSPDTVPVAVPEEPTRAKTSSRRGSRSQSRKSSRKPMDELALLRRARVALASKSPKRALALLERHAREHRNSAFAEEREALRVVALCDAGRLAAGEAARKRFVVRWPSSIHEAGLQQSCASSQRDDRPG